MQSWLARTSTFRGKTGALAHYRPPWTARAAWPGLSPSPSLRPWRRSQSLLFVGGAIGRIVGHLPVVVCTVLLASLVESLFILPAHLCGRYGPGLRHTLPGKPSRRGDAASSVPSSG